MMRRFHRAGRKLGHWPVLLAILIGVLVLAPVFTPAPVLISGSALAQQATRPSAAVVAPQPSSGGFYAWVMAKQAAYNKRLADTIRDIRSEPVVATLLLAALSFAYGIVHAAGPGHGKAVISSYVLANQQTARRGIQLAFLSSLFQALSAIVLFVILILMFKATGLTRKASEGWLETISWGLVVLLGTGMLYGQVRQLLAGRRIAAAPVFELGHEHVGHAHDHAHAHDHNHGASGSHNHGPGCHDHAHDQDHASCGHNHAHLPEPSQLEGAWSWTRALGLAFAVGIRPCTGAIFILGFALSQGLFWAGVFATFAMALGTAITVSALAALAVGSRELAIRLGGAGNSRWAGTVRTIAGVGGSLAVLVFGLILFVGSFGPQGAF